MKPIYFYKASSLLLSILFVAMLSAQADTWYHFYSDFETEDDQNQWTSEPETINPEIRWRYVSGGGNFPTVAAEGSLNARFHFPDESEWLISPPIDLSISEKPELAFLHAQVESVLGTDSSMLYFKAGATAEWEEIDKWNTEIPGWNEERFVIDDYGEKYLCEGFQFAFLGYSWSSNGICIDSVVLEEKAIVQKFVYKVNYHQINNEIITSRANQVPIVKIEIQVGGNDGESDLDSISFKLNEGSENYFKTSGFRLFLTENNFFQNEYEGISTQVGSSVSISGGTVTFSGLSHKLDIGKNYLWLTADFANDVQHNSPIVFGVESNSLKFNDSLMPGTSIDTVLYDLIEEAVFYDNFETDLGWDLTSSGGDFEIAVPQGLSADPDYTYSGTKVLGTDLTDDGLCVASVTAGSGYHATTPEFDLTYYDNVKIYMRKWTDFNYSFDSSSVSISNDGGATWIDIWKNIDELPIASSKWEVLFETVKTDQYLSKRDNVKIRFSVEKTGFLPESGFSIDQFTISGNHLETDVGVTEIISPFDDCIGFNNDTVKVVLRNYAEGASPAIIPVYYALWGTDSTIVRDTVRVSIPQDDSIVFTFSQLANFPKGDVYDQFVVGIVLDGDEDASNDELGKTLYIKDNLEPSVLTDFEYKGGVWTPSKTQSWTCYKPDDEIPFLIESPKSWILSSSGGYALNDLAYVTSACYDLTNVNRNIIQLKYWIKSDEGADGMALEYSVDDGENWSLLDTSVYGRGWGWYVDEVSALGHIGWSGVSDGWVTAKELLPDSFATEPKVKFRVKWASDASGNARGPAFDDFEVYPAPPDVGVSSIATPTNACEMMNDATTTVYVKNYGFNSLSAGDTVVVGVDFESEQPVIDTFQLASDLQPGDSVELTVSTNLVLDIAGSYDITAYTLIEDDPFLYGTNNDTASKSINIYANPTVILADTIGSRDPDTVNIVPQYPDWEIGYTYSWSPGGVTDSIYDVSANGFGPRVYNLEVTEPNEGCVTYDSINVLLLYFDAGSDSVVYPQSTCELDSIEYVTIRIKNTGTDSILVGDKIQAHYRVNGGTIFKDTITISETFYASQTFDHTFTNDPFDFSPYDTYSIEAWAHFGSGDTAKYNDSTYAVVQTFGYTPLDLGPDLTVQDTVYTLVADSGFTTYLWNNGDTTQTTKINESGSYWINASDPNGCPGIDTIDIWLKIRDISAMALISPMTSCERDEDSFIQFMVSNEGTDTIKTTDDITFSYTLNGGAKVEEVASPFMDILPGADYLFTFNSIENLAGYGEYKFHLTATNADEFNTVNDSITQTVKTNPNPDFDLGEDRVVSSVQEVLNAGSGPGHTYSWMDGEDNDSVYLAAFAGQYYCEVINTTTGCSHIDTVNLTFDYADYSIRSVGLLNTPCQGQAQENVEVEIMYESGSNPRLSTSLSIAVQIDDEEPTIENVTINSLWQPTTMETIELSNAIEFENAGSGSVNVYLSGINDLNPANDGIVSAVDVQPEPEVDFGADTLFVGFPHVLDPGSNFTRYQWSIDNSTNQTYTATQPGIYSVTVADASGCQSTTSVLLAITSIFDVAEQNMDVDLYPNPVSGMLNIETNIETHELVIFEIIDVTNRIVYTDTHQGIGQLKKEIDVSGFKPGVYFIRIGNSEMYYINRIVVK